jgi:hypothetical protein
MRRDIISQSQGPSGEANAFLAFLKAAPEGIFLSVHLQPRAAKNEVIGPMGGHLKVRVTAPPIEGAANEACREFLSNIFGIAKGRIRIVSGSKSRVKKVLLEGMDLETATSRISRLLQ